jgi:hypothetical protein
MTRNYEYLIWLITVGAAQGDIAALRAEWKAALAADGAEPEPEQPTSSTSWLSNITPALIDRAGRRSPVNHAHRGDLLGPSQSISMSDRFGGTDHGGFKR